MKIMEIREKREKNMEYDGKHMKYVVNDYDGVYVRTLFLSRSLTPACSAFCLRTYR